MVWGGLALLFVKARAAFANRQHHDTQLPLKGEVHSVTFHSVFMLMRTGPSVIRIYSCFLFSITGVSGALLVSGGNSE